MRIKHEDGQTRKSDHALIAIMDETFKYPRLYVESDLGSGLGVLLTPAQAHYLKNVLRKKEGDPARLFNARHGEWLGTLSAPSKKEARVMLQEQLRPQPEKQLKTALIFAPIKKNRFDWMIEKAVELGVTDFYPVLTQNTEVRKLNEERLQAQIFEAAEQCERLDIPALHSLRKLETLLGEWDKSLTIFACIERYDAVPLSRQESDIGLLIGPEGGFTREEKESLAKQDFVKPVTLGETVLRCETAAAKSIILARG